MKSNTQQLKIAEKYLGESCPKCCHMNNNCCCYFVSLTFKEAGNAMLFYGGKMVTYCPNAIKWCKANLAQIPIYLALPSDIIFFDWELNGTPNHIGRVDHRISDVEIATLEGNTTSKGVVARRVRTVKYIQGVFRPHFKATFDVKKKLEIDGYFGYNSIAVMQKVLGVKVDGILGKDTVKALQKYLGVSADGSWGEKTSKALQKRLKKDGYYKGDIDGMVYEATVKAFQKWLNAKAFPKATPKPLTWQQKATKWAEDTAKSGKYSYVKWAQNDEDTHECPICHPRKRKIGGNCIWWAFAPWHHGGGLKTKCSCDVLTNQLYERMLNMSEKDASELASERIGKKVKVIMNGGKKIPQKEVKEGDIGVLFKGKTYYHTIYCEGNGKYSDCTSGRTPNIKSGMKMSRKTRSNLKMIIRYVGD